MAKPVGLPIIAFIQMYGNAPATTAVAKAGKKDREKRLASAKRPRNPRRAEIKNAAFHPAAFPATGETAA
jgi:hypothetical protein